MISDSVLPTPTQPLTLNARCARLAPMILVALLALWSPRAAEAQSCILTRLDSPVLNAFDSEFGSTTDHWQVNFGWRYGYSFRHFVGTEEQKERVAEHSQVVNNVNLADISLRYNVNSRLSFELGVPYLMAERSGALRNSEREVVRRYTRSETEGVGDITLIGKWLVFDPATHGMSNISLGLGVKLPTGDYKQDETRIFLVNGQEVQSTATADLSVQPGDGGYGIIFEIGGYQILDKDGTFALYGTGTYIVAPQGTNGVERPGAQRYEEENSITDQYVTRFGLQVGPSSWRGFTVGLGGRMEGVPVRDLVGSSTGRRRPGYMASVEPSISWSGGKNAVSFSMPWAVIRNRQRSVADLYRGGHGDAAFPDYVVLSSYSRRF